MYVIFLCSQHIAGYVNIARKRDLIFAVACGMNKVIGHMSHGILQRSPSTSTSSPILKPASRDYLGNQDLSNRLGMPNIHRFPYDKSDATYYPMATPCEAALPAPLDLACSIGDLDTIESHISHQRATNPTYSPPWSAVIYTATSHDQVRIVAYSLSHSGNKVCDCVMHIFFSRHAKKIFIYLLENEIINVNHTICYFGDVLSNAAIANGFEWTRLCLEYGADPNTSLVDEYESVLAAVASQKASIPMVQLLQGSGAVILAAEEGKVEIDVVNSPNRA